MLKKCSGKKEENGGQRKEVEMTKRGGRELDLIKWMPLVKKQIKMIHFHCCSASILLLEGALVTKNKCPPPFFWFR